MHRDFRRRAVPQRGQGTIQNTRVQKYDDENFRGNCIEGTAILCVYTQKEAARTANACIILRSLPFAAHEFSVFHRCHADFFRAGVLADQSYVARAHRLLAQAQVLANQHANADTAHVETVQKVVNLLLVREFHILLEGKYAH